MKQSNIDAIKRVVIPIAKTYGIKRAYLFGSHARGSATADSDIDILIDKGSLKGLIQYFSFVNALEDAFKCHVDVVTTAISDKEFLSNIRSDEVLLYEED